MNRDHAQLVLFEQLKRNVPISAVLARYGIELRGHGANRHGCCPVHDGSNPKQFVVDENKGLWRCFGDCDRGGDVLNLVQELEKTDLRTAGLLLAEWFSEKPIGVVQHRSNQRSRAMSGERPSHRIYVVEGEGENAFWHRAGSAWAHKDAKGFNLQVPAGMALSGRIVLREYSEEDATDEKSNGKRRK